MKKLAVLTALTVAAAISHAATVTYTITISGPQVVPGPGHPTATGAGFFTFDPATGIGSLLSGGFGGLSTPVTGMHIHEGYPGLTGPIVHTLTPALDGSGTAGTFSWSGTLSDLVRLNSGGYYVQVHTSGLPDGAIRGQLIPEPHEYAMLAGLGLLGFVAYRRLRG